LSPQLFAAIFVVAAGALAVWFAVRFPALAPASFGRALIHLGASLVAFYIAVPALKPLVNAMGQPISLHVMIFGLLLPAFVYRLLSSIWILKLATDALGSRLR
jgi:hypothetical protein